MNVNFEVFKSTNTQEAKNVDQDAKTENKQDNNSIFDTEEMSIEFDSGLEPDEIDNVTKDIEGFAIEYGEDIEDIQFSGLENNEDECPSDADGNPRKKSGVEAVITKKDGSRVRIEYDENGKRNVLTERNQDGNIISRERYRDGKLSSRDELTTTKDGRPYLITTEYNEEGIIVRTEGRVLSTKK